VAGAGGADAAILEHLRGCEPDACPHCLEEARLYWTASGWRCGDCKAEAVLGGDFTAPVPPAAQMPHVAEVDLARLRRSARQRLAEAGPLEGVA
jgi:hypothetical protein